MDDVLSEDDNDEDDAEDHDSALIEEHPEPILRLGSYTSPEKVVRGTGLVFPSKFAPGPNPLSPLELFRRRVRFMNVLR